MHKNNDKNAWSSYEHKNNANHRLCHTANNSKTQAIIQIIVNIKNSILLVIEIEIMLINVHSGK